MQLTHQTWLLPVTTCLHRRVTHLLSSSALVCTKIIKKWLDEWFIAKGEDFYWCCIDKLPKRWERYITSNGANF
jgi:hypothetical protein